MSEEIPFLDVLGEQLRHAEPARRPGQSPLVRRALAAAAVLALLLVGVTTFRSDPVAAGVDVRRVGNRVQLQVEGVAPPASEIEEIAHRNGLDIRVREVPVGPSLVGRMSVYGGVDTSGDVRFGPTESRTADGSFVILSFPVNWKGHLQLAIGRPAHGDEEYWIPSNGLAPGELLACQRGSTAAHVQDLAERKGITIRWFLAGPVEPHPLQQVPYEEARAAVGYRVAYAIADGPHRADVQLTLGGQELEPRWFKDFPSC